MGPDSDSLYTVGEEVCNPAAGGGWESDVQQFICQYVREYGVKGRAKVNKEQSGIASLFQMGDGGVEHCADSILC